MDESILPPPVAGLGDQYDFLGELRRGDATTTWLAHERAAFRDVVVTVVHAGDEARGELLSRTASDASLLAVQRHPGVVPVLASHRLSDGSLAIVRPRLRATTLHGMIAAGGPMALDRTVALLRRVGDSLEWARNLGVGQRAITTEHVVVEPATGRTLVAFGPPLALDDAGPDTRVSGSDLQPTPALSHCSDTATLGRLAWEMLSARPAPTGAGAMSLHRGYREPSLADLRPDLPLSVAAEVESAIRCEQDTAVRGPGTFLDALAAAMVLIPEAATLPPRHSVRSGGPMAVAMPASPRPTRRSGAGIMAFTVLAVLVLAALAIWFQRSDRGPETASRGTEDSATVAAGDVDFDRSRVDTGVLVVPGNGRRPTAPMPLPAEMEPPPPTSGPTVFAPPGTQPSSIPAPAQEPLPPTEPVDRCDSPTEADQRACLRSRIEQNDVELNRSYQDLVRVLREDPAAVADLRARQREWLAQRDVACRDAGSGSDTWARVVADCMSAESARRARELREEMAARRP